MLNSQSGDFVDLFGFDVDFALELGRHFRERGGVDFYSGLLHAGEDGNEREIDFFVEFGESGLLYFVAKSGGEAAGDVGGFGEVAAELEIEAAEGDVGEAMRGVGGIEQVGVEHGIVLDALQS